jgi:hypothetical protein
MKIRTDFVSNSSSCSFVIEDTKNVKTFVSKFKVFDGVEIPYGVDSDIDIMIYTKYKHWVVVRDMLVSIGVISKGVYNTDTNEYFKKRVVESPDEESWDEFRFNLGNLAIMCASSICYELSELITSIRFRSEDYGEGPIYLRQIYDFCAINDCNPNDEESEMSFGFSDDSDYFKLIRTKIV